MLDIQPPVIEVLNGNSEVFVEQYAPLVLPDIQVVDEVDGPISKLEFIGNVQTGS